MAVRISNSKSYVAGGTIAANTLVKLDSTAGQVVTCGAGERPYGVAMTPGATLDVVSVAVGRGDTVMTACAATIALGAMVMCAADGKLTPATALGSCLAVRTIVAGQAEQAATAEGDIIEWTFDPFERL